MNPILIHLILNLLSLKKLFHLIVGVFIVVLSLPLLVILVLTNTGIPAVSDTLANQATKTTVTIHDPTGKVITRLTRGTTWPVHGVVTLEFGASDLPYQPVHTGIDIADRIGDPVTPFMKGKVIDIESLSWGYGNYVVIDNGDNITSLYAHMSKITVTKGQEVEPGDVIGLEGQTGWATGPHVHFEIRVYGIPVNPRTFVSGNP